MIKIFAKLHTSEKVLIFCTRNEVKKIQLALNNKYGGDWILVDRLEVTELLKFTDDFIYKGFETGKERYCSRIENL